MDDPLSRLQATVPLQGRFAVPLKWPELALRDQAGGDPSARIEILEVCPAAKLSRRTATLTQDGALVTIGNVKYADHRTGKLGWTALDAQCPGPDGHIHFQGGPFYYFDLFTNDRLADWGASYVHPRPPAEHPEEWEVTGGPAR
jgi:hypothetical protein